jgi:DUF1365 family protein
MTLESAPACIYSAEVMHRRFFDSQYRFRYRVFSLLLDIDALDRVAAGSALFSHNRFNLLSFHDEDHLPPGETSLRGWAERTLARAGLESAELKIRLLCFPRILGWGFNPLSLWFCETADGRPVAVIAEVRNTFGERHCYLLRTSAQAPHWPVRDSHAKEFHVSPFIGMQARYDFHLARPDARLRIAIREYRDDRLMLIATQTGERRAFDTKELARQVLRVPFQTLKVVAAIHWQALKLWLRGEHFHRKPAPPMEEVS